MQREQDLCVARPTARQMRRRHLLGLLLAGKAVDATSTVVVLRLEPSAREVVPLARWLMGIFGDVGGMVALTAVSVVAVALVAEAGTFIERLLPEVTPEEYPHHVRTGVSLVTATWFLLVGVHNVTLLF